MDTNNAIQVIKYPAKRLWPDLLARPQLDNSLLRESVQKIIDAVKMHGDAALISFTKQFDKVELLNLKVSNQEVAEANKLVSNELKAALDIARVNIEKFHLSQRETITKIETMPGVVCWRKSVPITKVGLYIPGGTAPLFSSILMLAIPAIIAGCSEIVVCTPPNEMGKIDPAILYTCELLGLNKVYKVGGAQAVAAMTFGTSTVPAVSKIFGPGNQYVTAAKQIATNYGVAIDMPAGPSEVAIVGDKTCIPAFAAADLLSQAEHGRDSQTLFISDDEFIINAVVKEVAEQAAQLDRKQLINESLQNSKCILVANLSVAIEMINEYAPEHLIIQTETPEQLASEVVNAGSVFLGHYTPEAAGDYASGTNHTLPTNGYARAYSGVSLDSFVKKITYQQISKDGIIEIGPTIQTLAEAEQLLAHKNAVTLRLRQ